MMTILINNIEKMVNDNISLTELLNDIDNLPQSGFAVAVNNSVIAKDKRDGYLLSPNDKVMIIRAFYGG